MIRQYLELVNIAVIGSTRLTYKLLSVLEEIQRPKLVFGLPDAWLSKKVNAIALDDFCAAKGILLDKSNHWRIFEQYCQRLHIQLILEFGDSRIIPDFLTGPYQIIGNHGAILPAVQGAASLVWGRLLNSTQWGVSLFEVNDRIDAGDILAVTRFDYDPAMPMRPFVELADNATIRLFQDIVNQGYIRRENSPWQVKIAANTDTHLAVHFLEQAQQQQANIYLPPRSPSDSHLKEGWPATFQTIFKVANNDPYPRWYC